MTVSEDSLKLSWFENIKDKIAVCYYCGNVWLPKKVNTKYCNKCTNPLGEKPKYKRNIKKQQKGEALS